jgi:hypothetical protein
MSISESVYSVPPLNTVEFHFDRRKASLVGGTGVLAGLLIAWPTAAAEALYGAAPEFAAAIVALAGAAALVATGLFLLMRILLWRGPVVVINGLGIHDRRRGAIMTPWSCVQDVRPLDLYGRHIAIASYTGPENLAPPDREPMAVIDTFFLKSVTGNRVLDFVMPITAMTPIDMSEMPVSDATLTADAALARRRQLFTAAFVATAGVIPAIAALHIVL